MSVVEEVSRLLSQARGAYQREQYQVALAYFQQACQVDAHSPEALLGLGEVSSFLGFRDQAINAFLALADLYLRAAMFEVAAEVIERILDLDATNDVALRFQRFIQPRLRPNPSEQITAVTLLDRPTPVPERRDSDQLTAEINPWRRPSTAGASELDDIIGDLATPPETVDPARARTELAPRLPAPTPAIKSRYSSTLVGIDPDDEEDGSEVRTKTFDHSSPDLDVLAKKGDVVFDFGDDEDDDLVSYTDLDPDARSPEEIFASQLKASPTDTVETAVEIPRVREAGVTEADEDDVSTRTEPAPDPDVITGDSKQRRSDNDTEAEEPATTDDGVPVDPVAEMFGDVSTRAVPEEMMEALAQSGEDPFSSDTVEGEVPLRDRGANEPDTAVKAPSPALIAATGTGRHETGDSWDADTEAAIAAENFRKRPAISIDADNDQLDLSDFPSFEENKQENTPSPVTHAIAYEHKDTLMLLEELAASSPFISQLGPDQRLSLVQDGALLQCFAGQVVCREGDRGRDLYLLLTGQAAVERIVGNGSPQRIASLSPGAFFGEGSVLADAPRSITVRVIEDALLIEIERSRLQSMVKDKPELLTVLTRFLRARLVSSLMMSSPLFFGLDMDERAALAPLLHLHKLNPGQQVVKRGQLLTGFCTVMAGELERFDLAEGTGKQVFGPLRVGDSFGTDCLRNRPSTLSIGAVTGCWLIRLPTANLRELINQHPELLAFLTEADQLV